MIPVKCAIKHDPPNSYGDCLRACVASILDLPSKDVPHFYESGEHPDVAMTKMDEFLETKGLTYVPMQAPNMATVQSMLEMIAINLFNNHYIILTDGHAVVCKGDKIVHDPAWLRQPLKKPKDGFIIIMLVVR